MAEPSDRPVTHEDQVGLDLEAVAQRLREERAEVSARLATMNKDLESVFAASVDSNADDEHDPEGQTIAYERSQLSALIRAAQEHLSGIETATARLEQGDYGTCEVCLQPIPAARLEARPTARSCVQHPARRGTRVGPCHAPIVGAKKKRATSPRSASVELVLLGPETREACADLRVGAAQWKFVAPVPHYLALCEQPGSPWEPLAVVASDRVVGFVMKGVDPADASFWIGGLMIASQDQGRGYGSATVESLIAQATAARHRSVALSYQPGNTRARALYLSVGFIETGEMQDDEVVARLPLR